MTAIVRWDPTGLVGGPVTRLKVLLVRTNARVLVAQGTAEAGPGR